MIVIKYLNIFTVLPKLLSTISIVPCDWKYTRTFWVLIFENVSGEVVERVSEIIKLWNGHPVKPNSDKLISAPIFCDTKVTPKGTWQVLVPLQMIFPLKLKLISLLAVNGISPVPINPIWFQVPILGALNPMN